MTTSTSTTARTRRTKLCSTTEETRDQLSTDYWNSDDGGGVDAAENADYSSYYNYGSGMPSNNYLDQLSRVHHESYASSSSNQPQNSYSYGNVNYDTAGASSYTQEPSEASAAAAQQEQLFDDFNGMPNNELFLQSEEVTTNEDYTNGYSTSNGEDSHATNNDYIYTSSSEYANTETETTTEWYEQTIPSMEQQQQQQQKINAKDEDLSKYVLLGRVDNSTLDSDPILQYVTSEVQVWKQFRDARRRDGLPLDVVISRTWDTAEDLYVQYKRKIAESLGASRLLTPEQDASRKTVVLLGSGWAAHAFMKVADCQKLRIIVVSPTNHFVFTPMLASAAVGSVEYRSMTEAVRQTNPLIHDYIEGKAMDINLQDKTVTVKLNALSNTRPRSGDYSSSSDGYIAAIEAAQEQQHQDRTPTIELQYDHLLVSVGSKVARRNVPGAKEYAYKLKTTANAKELRTAVGECFEYASRPDVAGNTPEQIAERSRRVTFLIAGGGPTGVELAGELCDLFEDITRPYKGTYPRLKDSVRVILAASGPDLVPQFEQPLRDAALKSLRNKGVDVYLNTRVNEITPTMAVLSVRGFNEKGYALAPREVKLPIGLSVWCAGTTPVSFVENLLQQLPEEARNRDGRVKVDRWMRPPMPDPSLLGSVLVLGDAAAQPSGDYEGAGFLPATAQVAGQQGAYLARTLSRNYNLTTTPPKMADIEVTRYPEFNVFYDPGMNNWLKFRGLEHSPPFTFLNLGMLAYVGGNEALSQIQIGDTTVTSQSGSTGFLLWRSVYLVKQVATRNRALVTFDWLKTSVFGRDITRL